MPETEDIDVQLEEMRKAEGPPPENQDEPEQQEAQEGAQEESQEETQEGDAIEGGEAEPPKQPGTVPLNVALEWKRENKDLRRDVGELRQQMGELLKAINSGKPEQEEQVPSLDDAPVEYLAWQSKQAQKEIGELRDLLQSQSTQAQAAQAQNQITQVEQNFAQQHPDYWQAEAHLRQKRVQYYQDAFGMTEDQALMEYGKEANRFIEAQSKMGRNFAEAAYDLAKREGFKAQQQQQAPDKDESLKALGRKITQSRSLASSSGKGGPKDEITPQDAAEMDEDEFEKLFTGPDGDKNFQRLFGG